ncbi:MAG: hypothetical protein IPH65_10750 [Dehalococcoidia bacterium]|uniref:hypothetical protein n=1 Tax=Candidatus Amarobacter glycogenicus TaxID=3140699 RepID=UPI0031353D4E|nr:hypothetical protein [Dehalococcoidia bacterium]
MADRFGTSRYCGRCGEIFDGSATTCPECGGIWPEELPRDLIAVYALLLTEIHNLRRNGAISEATFAQMRRVYEERLLAVRPARRRAPEPEPVAPLANVVPVPDAAVVPVSDMPAPPVAPPPPPFRPPRPAAPPKPPGHVTLDLRNWAARRQADLVLYLGAFLLSISALIFVSYTGSGGGAKSALFGLYTLLFLVLGIQLRKWERVQEAGPVFLGLGAVLVPLNFVAIYTNVLRHEDVSREYVWLAGSLSTAWLYSLLAWRDFGKFYWLPAAGAYLAAYASLGACLHFASEWYGPWFVALGAAGVAAAPRLPVPPRARGFVEGGSYALVSAALLYTHQAVAFEEGAHAAIPVAYAFTAAAIARSAFPSRRPIFLGLLPPVSVMTLASAGWAIDPWAETVVTWSPVSLLAVAAGYLAVAKFQPRHGPAWRSLALAFGIVALVLAHGRAAEGDSRWLLPVAYALSSLIAAGWYGACRYVPALAFLPPLLAAAAASTFWAADALAYEWLGTFAVFAAVGYALIARRRPAEAEVWGMLAASSGATAIAISHAATAFSGINRWELPAVYGLAAGGAAFDAFRFRPSALLGAFALAIGGAAALWAFEVDRAYWAFPAIGISLVILASERAWVRDAGLATLAWPGALILAATPVLLVDAYTDEAWVGAAAFAAAAIAIFGLALRTNGAFSALAGHTSDRASRIEQQMLARGGAWALFASGGMVDVALELSAIESAWTFAIAGIALWLAVAGLGKWLRSLDEVLGPVGLSAFALAVLLGHEGPGHVSMMLGLGTVAASLAVRGRFAMAWRAAYAGGACLALLFAHLHAAEAGADAWQLPAAYGLTIVALLWDGAWNRYQPAMLFVPAVATVGAGTAVWWRGWPDQHMAWTPLAFALGIAATERLWMRGSVLRPAALAVRARARPCSTDSHQFVRGSALVRGRGIRIGRNGMVCHRRPQQWRPAHRRQVRPHPRAAGTGVRGLQPEPGHRGLPRLRARTAADHLGMGVRRPHDHGVGSGRGLAPPPARVRGGHRAGQPHGHHRRGFRRRPARRPHLDAPRPHSRGGGTRCRRALPDALADRLWRGRGGLHRLRPQPRRARRHGGLAVARSLWARPHRAALGQRLEPLAAGDALRPGGRGGHRHRVCLVAGVAPVPHGVGSARHRPCDCRIRAALVPRRFGPPGSLVVRPRA